MFGRQSCSNTIRPNGWLRKANVIVRYRWAVRRKGQRWSLYWWYDRGKHQGMMARQREETKASRRQRVFPFSACVCVCMWKIVRWDREGESEREMWSKTRHTPCPDGATPSVMVPSIIKADLPSLLVLAHGGLANGEAALQPAAFAALQTYPGVGKCFYPLSHSLSHSLCSSFLSNSRLRSPSTIPKFQQSIPVPFFGYWIFSFSVLFHPFIFHSFRSVWFLSSFFPTLRPFWFFHYFIPQRHILAFFENKTKPSIHSNCCSRRIPMLSLCRMWHGSPPPFPFAPFLIISHGKTIYSLMDEFVLLMEWIF